MFYVIQENTWNEYHYNLLMEMMERFKLDHEICRFIPFVNKLEATTTRKDVFCFGMIAAAQTAAEMGWYPGSMYNANHNFEVYAPKYGLENMLNGDGKIITFTDDIPLEDERFHVRLTKDSKYFGGEVHTHDSWNEYRQKCIDNYTAEILLNESNLLVSPLKDIQQEVRCWVVGGKVVTASRYKLFDRVSYQNYDDEYYYTDFAQAMVDKYQPAEAFVLDVCLANDQLKVVEVNCINAAGFYHCNLYKLIEALENHFG